MFVCNVCVSLCSPTLEENKISNLIYVIINVRLGISFDELDAVLQIIRDNFGIIIHIFNVKHRV